MCHSVSQAVLLHFTDVKILLPVFFIRLSQDPLANSQEKFNHSSMCVIGVFVWI